MALRERYGDDCLFIPWYSGTMHAWSRNQFIYVTSLGGLFAVAFVAFGSALARTCLATRSRRVALTVGALASLTVYLAVAGLVWFRNPLPGYGTGQNDTRAYLSAFWPIGLLKESGHYNSRFCGQ